MEFLKTIKFDEKNGLYHKYYEYNGLKALRTFLGFSKERANQSQKMYNSLKIDIPELNLMRVLEAKVYKRTPWHIKSYLKTEDINKTFDDKFISYEEFLLLKNSKNEVFNALEKWRYFYELFVKNGYYHLDLNFTNILVNDSLGRYVLIDFDEIVQSNIIQKRVYKKQSIRQVCFCVKNMLLKLSISNDEKIEVFNELVKIKKYYGIKDRKKDIFFDEMILEKLSN